MNTQFLPERLFLVFTSLASLSVFIYIIIKANNLAFTGDEAASFYDIKYMNFGYLFGAIANSHLLNTLYIYPFVKLDIYNVFVLRFANVVAFIVYTYACFRLLKPIENQLIASLGFVLLISNQFLIDYFTLCRGYGLAIGFMMLSLVHVIKFTKEFNIKDLYKLSIFGILSTWSNYSYLYFYLIVFGIVIFTIIKKEKEFNLNYIFSKYKYLIIINLAFSIITIPILYNLKKSGALWWGGENGFWADTVFSLIDATVYYQKTFLSELILLSIIIIAITISFSVLILCIFKKKETSFLYFFLICVGISLLTVFLFYGIENLYLLERTAIIHIPLFLMMFVWAIAELSFYPKVKNLAIIVLIGLTCLSSFQFIKSANTRYTYTYFPDSQVDELVEDLKKLEKGKNRQINIASGFHFVTAINFYKDSKQYDWIQTVGFDLLNPAEGGFYNVYYNQYPNRGYDYFYFWEKDEWYFRRLYNFKIIKKYSTTKTCLAVAINDKTP